MTILFHSVVTSSYWNISQGEDLMQDNFTLEVDLLIELS